MPVRSWRDHGTSIQTIEFLSFVFLFCFWLLDCCWIVKEKVFLDAKRLKNTGADDAEDMVRWKKLIQWQIFVLRNA